MLCQQYLGTYQRSLILTVFLAGIANAIRSLSVTGNFSTWKNVYGAFLPQGMQSICGRLEHIFCNSDRLQNGLCRQIRFDSILFQNCVSCYNWVFWNMNLILKCTKSIQSVWRSMQFTIYFPFVFQKTEKKLKKAHRRAAEISSRSSQQKLITYNRTYKFVKNSILSDLLVHDDYMSEITIYWTNLPFFLVFLFF